MICIPGTARISQRFRCFGAMAMVREPRIFAAMAKTTGCSFAAFNPTSTVLRKMVGEIRGIARGATGRTVMWC